MPRGKGRGPTVKAASLSEDVREGSRDGLENKLGTFPLESAPAAEAAIDRGDFAKPAAGKALVAAFSWSGNTLRVAERINRLVASGLFRIELAEPCMQDCNELLDVVQAEQGAGVRPALAAAVEGWGTTMSCTWDTRRGGMRHLWTWQLAKHPGETSKRLEGDAYAKFRYDATADVGAAVVSRVAEIADGRGVAMSARLWLAASVQTNERKSIMAKKLVAYFSATGTTKKIAQKLAETAEADLFEIVPEIPYTAADLNWNDRASRSSKEMRDRSSRPKIASRIEDIDAYDTVFVGFPIWWYVAPTIVNTFLEQYDFTGKKVVPFATSGGSGMGETNRWLAPSCPGAILLPGKRLSSGDKAALRAWLSEI